MSNQYKKELLNALKKYNLVSLIKTQITKHKFNMLCTFDGTIVPGSIMTINQLAEIVTKGFAKIEVQFEKQEKFNEDQRKFNEDQKKFNEEQKKFNALVLERFEDQKKFNGLVLERFDKIEIKLDEHTRILDEHTRMLNEHADIFKRNNLK